MKPRTATVFIDDVECTAHFDYSPGRPACRTQRNGDPGWPEDPAGVVVNYIVPVGGLGHYEVPPSHEGMVELACLESAMQEDEDLLHAYYESRERRCE